MRADLVLHVTSLLPRLEQSSLLLTAAMSCRVMASIGGSKAWTVLPTVPNLKCFLFPWRCSMPCVPRTRAIQSRQWNDLMALVFAGSRCQADCPDRRGEKGKRFAGRHTSSHHPSAFLLELSQSAASFSSKFPTVTKRLRLQHSTLLYGTSLFPYLTEYLLLAISLRPASPGQCHNPGR